MKRRSSAVLPKMVMPLDYWAKYFDKQAKKWGWTLFDNDGIITIQKLDDPMGELTDKQYEAVQAGKSPAPHELDSDQHALNFIVGMAERGDIVSLLALYLDGKPVNKEADLPKSLQRKSNPKGSLRM